VRGCHAGGAAGEGRRLAEIRLAGSTPDKAARLIADLAPVVSGGNVAGNYRQAPGTLPAWVT
jgi:hypothetical protein